MVQYAFVTTCDNHSMQATCAGVHVTKCYCMTVYRKKNQQDKYGDLRRLCEPMNAPCDTGFIYYLQQTCKMTGLVALEIS